MRVLYAGPDRHDVEQIERHFSDHAPHIELDFVASAHEVPARLGQRIAQSDPYDGVVLDARLPDSDAPALIASLRNDHPDLPIVWVEAPGDTGSAASALRLGASEIVTRGAGFLPELQRAFEQCHRQALRDREHAALVRTTEQLHHLLEASPIVLYSLRIDGDQVVPLSISDNIERLFGYTRAEALQSDWWNKAVALRDPNQRQEWLSATLRHGRNVLKYRLRHKNGTDRWVRDEQRLIRDRHGRPSEIVGALTDATEQHIAEERLKVDDAIFAVTRDGVIVTDQDANIEAVNRAVCEITGYDSEELIGQNPRVLRSNRHDPEFFRAMWQTLLERGFWEGEIWNRRKNSEIYPQWATIRSICDDQGAVRRYVAVLTDLSQLHQSQSQLEHLTHYDALTGLPNRLLIRSRLEHTLDQAKRRNTPVGVIILDLDQFKSVNDGLGHTEGDEVLVAVSSRLKNRMRAADTVGRLNGDEYAVLLDDIRNQHDIARVADDLLRLLEPPFLLAGGHEVYMQASIGISVFPGDGESADDMLRSAYAAVHSVKESGGNAYRFYAAEMNAEALRTVELEAGLRRAEARGELRLYYQPKIDLRSGQIVGAEALLRWQRDDGTLTAPLEFIPIAERTGLIVSIGAWVINEACRQIRAWSDAGIDDIHVAVNVSARQFRSTALEETIGRALAHHRVPPSQLEIELTESMLLEHPEDTVERLNALKSVGVKLALDDFGTGYSSLAYLQRFPIDCLKIDRSFVERLVHDRGSATIAVSIIALAHRMQLKVVAEGVETEAQLNFLRNSHCDIMQGYYFSEALPEHDFAAMLRKRTSPALPPAPNGEQRHLLVVDDEPSIVAALQRLLRNENYRVLGAESAHRALELMAEHPVQVVLSDQSMPGTNGTELMEHIKALYPHTVRIICSGYADINAVVDAVNKGAIYKFLFKPWDGDQLVTQIRDAFEFYEAVIKPRSELEHPF